MLADLLITRGLSGAVTTGLKGAARLGLGAAERQLVKDATGRLVAKDAIRKATGLVSMTAMGISEASMMGKAAYDETYL
jgi:hypothetical protein